MRKTFFIFFYIIFAAQAKADVDLGNLEDITWQKVGGEYVAVFQRAPYWWDNAINSSKVFWEFETNSTPTPDTSYIATNTGLLVSDPAWVSSSNDISGCFFFNGTSDYIWKTNGLGDFLDHTNGTVILWARSSSLASNTDRLWSFSRASTGDFTSLSFGYDTEKLECACEVDGTMQWGWRATNYHLRAAEGWRFFAVVHDGAEIKVYRGPQEITENGGYETTTDKTKWLKAIFTDATNPADHFAVGGMISNSVLTDGYTGWADSFKDYDRALSSDEIASCFWNTCAGYGLSGWDIQNKNHYSNASLIATCSFPGEDSVIPSQEMGFYSNNVWHGFGRGGLTVNGATWAEKEGRSCYYLDGSDDYISFSTFPSLTDVSNFTVSVWFYLWENPSFSGDDVLIYRYSGSSTDRLTIRHKSADELNHRIYLANGESTYADTSHGLLSTGQWHHVVLSFDGSGATNDDKLKYYLNGSEYALSFSGTMPAKTSSSIHNLLLGSTGSASHLPAYIGPVRVWAGNGGQYTLASNVVAELHGAEQ